MWIAELLIGFSAISMVLLLSAPEGMYRIARPYRRTLFLDLQIASPMLRLSLVIFASLLTVADVGLMFSHSHAAQKRVAMARACAEVNSSKDSGSIAESSSCSASNPCEEAYKARSR
jgi:hypothetical protein